MDEYLVGIEGYYPSTEIAPCAAIAALKIAERIKAKAGTVIRAMLFPFDRIHLYAVLPNHGVVSIN